MSMNIGKEGAALQRMAVKDFRVRCAEVFVAQRLSPRLLQPQSGCR